jgi:GTP-binding protein Era
MYKIVAYIYVESDSQKYIVIWKNGSLIKEIWTQARKELEEILEKKVFLALRVKVRKNWRKDKKFVKKILD